MITGPDSAFDMGRMSLLREGDQVTIAGCGAMVYEALLAADLLEDQGVGARVLAVHTLDPFDGETIGQAALETGDILGIIAKEAKQREESIEAFKQGNRQDLVAQEDAELAILKEYLPQQMTREEITDEARRIIEEVGAKEPRDKGKVMPRLVAELKGRADGRQINEVVTELLGS